MKFLNQDCSFGGEGEQCTALAGGLWDSAGRGISPLPKELEWDAAWITMGLVINEDNISAFFRNEAFVLFLPMSKLN